MTSFIESGFTTRAEYEAHIKSGGSGAAGEFKPTLGYWKIRGLAASCRMMFFYKSKPFVNKAYGEDFGAKWFAGDKVKMAETNSMMNLPYIKDGDTIITQSNSCMLYLGKKLGIDKEEFFFRNHQALDQAMDLRNDLMKIVYPFAGIVKTSADVPAALEKHMETATTHFKKLEGFCTGPFMCGKDPQSADFHVFEMVDQHIMMCTELKVAFDISKFPKLNTLRLAMKGNPALAEYFASDMYLKYAVNTPTATTYVGAGYGKGPFGPTTEELVSPKPVEPKAAKGGKGPAQQAKQTPEEKAKAAAAKDAEKLRAKIIKEGGKKGVEIEGASDMGGLDFFCTTMELPEGDADLLELSMNAMNADPDPEAEDRKGCSGHVGKMIFSAGVTQLAMVAYVPDGEHNKSADKVDVTEWMKEVCEKVGGCEVLKPAFAADSPKGGKMVVAVAKSNPESGKFALKDKDTAMAAAFAFLRTKGAFPEDNDDDSDEMVFGDDDNLDDYE